ncbi:MAG: FAD:protein FMN transferase [Gammaproteobacteria bacterium]
MGAASAVAGTGPSATGTLEFATRTMGTVVELGIRGADPDAAAVAASAVFAEFARLDRLMSSWRPDSAVARINAAAGQHPVKVSAEVVAVIAAAQEVARRSDGAFDITVGAFRGLWKFDEDMDGSLPDEAAVAARRALVDYHDVIVQSDSRQVMLARTGMRLTLGGAAKGYAVDRARVVLGGHGIADFVIRAGGDTYVGGRRDGHPWRVGIRDPRGPREHAFARLSLSNAGAATSGDYARGFVRDGIRYHHILDPATAHPARRSRSVTVIAAGAMRADMWSTALFVLGPGRGLPLAERLPGLKAVFVGADNAVSVSSGLAGRLEILQAPSPGP